MNTHQQQPNPEQSLIAALLAKEYGIPKERVFFPDLRNPNKPWLGADELTSIARQSDRFQAIEEKYDCFIEALNQIVHEARVITKDGLVFSCVGVAMINEPMPDGTASDVHRLAASRALVATLSAAGFNPLRGALQGGQGGAQKPSITFDQQAEERKSQLRQIHALAEEGGLILYADEGRDDSRYRQFLRDHFGVDSVGAMNSTERALVINKLKMFNVGIENL